MTAVDGGRAMASGARGVESIAVPVWRAAVAQAGMELRLTARRGENLLVMVAIPVAMLVFFASVSILPLGAGRAVDFLVPGTLALAIISTSLVNLGIATAYERAYGVLKRLGGSPLSRPGLLAGKLAAVAVVEVLQVLLLVGVAVALYGWAPGSGWNPAVVLAALVVGTLAFAGLGLAMAGGLRAEATLAGANALFLVLLMLGGIVLPVDHLPAILADLARILPASALSDALRIGFGAESGSVAGPLALLGAWAVGAILVAARTFRWE